MTRLIDEPRRQKGRRVDFKLEFMCSHNGNSFNGFHIPLFKMHREPFIITKVMRCNLTWKRIMERTLSACIKLCSLNLIHLVPHCCFSLWLVIPWVNIRIENRLNPIIISLFGFYFELIIGKCFFARANINAGWGDRQRKREQREPPGWN